MKKLILPILISLSFCSNTLTQNIHHSDAKEVAKNKIELLGMNNSHSINNDSIIIEGINKHPLLYLFELIPSGYIIVTTNKMLPPVIAYSFKSDFINDENIQNPLKEMLIADIESRMLSMDIISKETIEKRKQEWENLLIGQNRKSNLFQQWPEGGTTSTGGWLETNWTQSSPYNIYCPIDPVTSQKSYVGCPATAMAQIVNYYEAINSTKFTDVDDYYHSYAGRNFWIDDDYEEYDFLSFPTVNVFLDSIAAKYENYKQLTTDEKAALSFACGIAARQVFTSEGSGTFGVDQAYDAYMKFGFNDAVLMESNDTNMFNVMSQNMMEARPVHLAVVTEQWDSGHNVVVDGYNTDDYYHVNFGWGGSNNGWYLLPEEMPYNLTVIEGVIVDIAYPPVYTNIHNFVTNSVIDVKIYPNPASDFIHVELELIDDEKMTVSIIDLHGRTIYKANQNKGSKKTKQEFSLDLNSISGEKINSGTYLLTVESSGNIAVAKFEIR